MISLLFVDINKRAIIVDSTNQLSLNSRVNHVSHIRSYVEALYIVSKILPQSITTILDHYILVLIYLQTMGMITIT